MVSASAVSRDAVSEDECAEDVHRVTLKRRLVGELLEVLDTHARFAGGRTTHASSGMIARSNPSHSASHVGCVTRIHSPASPGRVAQHTCPAAVLVVGLPGEVRKS